MVLNLPRSLFSGSTEEGLAWLLIAERLQLILLQYSNQSSVFEIDFCM